MVLIIWNSNLETEEQIFGGTDNLVLQSRYPSVSKPDKG